MADVLEEIRAFAERRVALGFDPDDMIVADANDVCFDRTGRDDLLPVIERIVAEVSELHRIEQAKWDAPTDCDRIDEAFANLEEQGVVARQNFACCNNCGFAEIWDEVEATENDHPVEGYTFFHFQFTEAAFDHGELLLAYGSVEDNRETFICVGRTIVRVLTQAGLKASWKEDAGYPIIVSGLEWKKRRLTSPPSKLNDRDNDTDSPDRLKRRGSCSSN
jgi:hypothetical protein